MSIFKVPQRIVHYIPPLVKLGHDHIAICFVLISLKLLINMVFNQVNNVNNMHLLTGLPIHVCYFLC